MALKTCSSGRQFVIDSSTLINSHSICWFFIKERSSYWQYLFITYRVRLRIRKTV